MTHYMVTGYRKKFRTMEDAEIFRLNAQKEGCNIGMRIIKVTRQLHGQTELELPDNPVTSFSRKRIPA